MSIFHRIALLSLAPLISATAEVSLPAVFSDHMVLQHGASVPVWGTAAPGEAVRVRFGDQTVETTATDMGAWNVTLTRLEVSREPRELTVTGTNRLVFQDVLVGEVWLCSGQSNMEKPLGEQRGQRPTDNYRSELAAARFPQIRLYQVPHFGKVADSAVEMRWLPCSPESLAATRFSAAGYFFGRELAVNLDVPVGLIHSSFGGTMIEAWTPPEAFASHPEISADRHEPYFAWVKGVQATELYTTMLKPLIPYALRGFIWYQGEANASVGESTRYAARMEALVDGWRNAWKLDKAPFYYVQLAPFRYSRTDAFPAWLTEQGLPLFWEAQSAARSRIASSGMVVTTDLAGDASDIHPTRKREVGQRLAHLALQETYGDTTRVARSPVFLKQEIMEEGTIRLTFDHVGGGLARSDGDPLGFFEIADKSRTFVPAVARIISDAVVEVSSSVISKPVAVRFAWTETASPNLVNSAGLPAEPFRTDDWPVENTRVKPGSEIGWETTVPEILSRIKAPVFPKRDFPVTDFGAVADDGKPDTEAIRSAIEACHAAGGGRVVVAGGVFDTAAIHLLSNVNLHVEAGATLLFSTDKNAYPIVQTRFEGTELMNVSPLIYAFGQENIAVTGTGTLDGAADKSTWWITDRDPVANTASEASKIRLLAMAESGVPVADRVFGPDDFLRPNFIQTYRCRNVLIEGVKIVRSPMWEVHPVLSTNVTVRGLHISSHGPNNDGCDPEASNDVLIEDCTFDTGDDCIAIKSGKNNDGRRVGVASENIIIRRNRMIDGHGGVVLGSEVSGNIRNVFVEDCVMDSPRLNRALRFKSNTVRGGIVENIFMRRVKVGQTAIAVLTVNFLYDHANQGPFRPVVRNVRLEEVTSSGSPRVLSIVGIPEGVIEGIHLKNCSFTNITAPDILQNVGRLTFENVTTKPANP